MNLIIMLVGILVFGLGLINYVKDHVVVKTRTEIIRVYIDSHNAIQKVIRSGEWDESLEWLVNDK